MKYMPFIKRLSKRPEKAGIVQLQRKKAVRKWHSSRRLFKEGKQKNMSTKDC